MLILQWGEKISAPCALLLGGFDGLHAGHMALLAAAKKTGLPVALTAMYGGKGRELFTAPERRFLFERAGVDIVYEIGFTPARKQTSAEEFAEQLFSAVHAETVVCGEDFRFGRDARGDVALLARYKETRTVPAVCAGGEKISATRIKALVSAGDLRGANALGCGYFVEGTVERGRQVGRTIGFPTLNLSLPDGKLLPPDGVYGGMCATPRGNFPCIVNFGARPTFGVAEKKLEAYLDGFSGDLYGGTVRVYPTERFRGVEKFPTVEALQSQLERDIKRLRESI